MNAKSTAGSLGAATVPGALVVGAALIATSFAGLRAERDRYRAEAGRARPTATVTAVPAAHPNPASPTAVATASPTAAATVLAVIDRTAAMPHNASGGLSHRQARPPSAPSPSPAAAPCSGRTLTVRVRHAACVTIGGGS